LLESDLQAQGHDKAEGYLLMVDNAMALATLIFAAIAGIGSHP
jgi:hypothetical protein